MNDAPSTDSGPDPKKVRVLSCSQDGRPALIQVNGLPLCVDCYHKLVVAQTLQFQQHAAMMNLAMAEMEAATGGLGRGPRLQIPQLPNGAISNTSVTVNGSTIGAINTGTINGIVVNMKNLGAAGHHEVERAIKTLTEAVIHSQAATVEQKNELLEQVDYVVAQAAAKPEERKASVLRSIVTGLGASLGAVADLATVWEQVGPVIRGALGL